MDLRAAMGMPFFSLPGTPKCDWLVYVSLVADVGWLDDPAIGYEGCEAVDPPVTSWYDGGGSAGMSEFDAMLIKT